MYGLDLSALLFCTYNIVSKGEIKQFYSCVRVFVPGMGYLLRPNTFFFSSFFCSWVYGVKKCSCLRPYVPPVGVFPVRIVSPCEYLSNPWNFIGCGFVSIFINYWLCYITSVSNSLFHPIRYSILLWYFVFHCSSSCYKYILVTLQSAVWTKMHHLEG